MKNKQKKGFTLIELLAVIVILAIVSTVVVTIGINIYNSSKYKSTTILENNIYTAALTYIAEKSDIWQDATDENNSNAYEYACIQIGNIDTGDNSLVGGGYITDTSSVKSYATRYVWYVRNKITKDEYGKRIVSYKEENATDDSCRSDISILTKHCRWGEWEDSNTNEYPSVITQNNKNKSIVLTCNGDNSKACSNKPSLKASISGSIYTASTSTTCDDTVVKYNFNFSGINKGIQNIVLTKDNFDISSKLTISNSIPSLTIDTSGPEFDFIINDGNTYINSTNTDGKVLIKVINEINETVKYCIGDSCSNFTKFNNAIIAEEYDIGTGSETKTVYVTMKDKYDNKNTKSQSVILDNDPPSGIIWINTKSDKYTASPIVDLHIDGSDYDYDTKTDIDPSWMCISEKNNVNECDNWIKYKELYEKYQFDDSLGEKTVYIWFKDRVGNVSDTSNASITYSLPPTGSIVINKSDYYSNGKPYTNSRDVILTLLSDKATKMCFSEKSDNVNDCNKWNVYSETYNYTLTSEGEGSKTVYAFFKDEFDVASKASSDSITLDTIAPIFTNCEIVGDSENRTITINVAAKDEGNGISSFEYYDLDYGSWIGFMFSSFWGDNSDIKSLSTVYTNVEDGTYDMQFFAVDKADNKSDVCSEKITIGQNLPNPIIKANDGIASGEWHSNTSLNNKNLILSFSVEDYTKEVTYKYGTSASNLNYTGNSVTITASQFNTTYYVQACDTDNKCSEISQYIVEYDKINPTIGSITKNKTAWTRSSVTFYSTLSDTISTLKCYKITTSSSQQSSCDDYSINGSTNYNLSYSATSNGTYYIWVWDQAGNVSKSSVSISNIDSTLPSINNVSLSTYSMTNTNVMIYANLQDDISTLACYKVTTDSSTPTSCNWAIQNYTSYNLSYSATSNGTYYIWVWDQAGNVNYYSVSITNIDKTPPTIDNAMVSTVNDNYYINARIYDEYGVAYGITMGETPDFWNGYYGGEYWIYESVDIGGYHYIYAKDEAGNKTSEPIYVNIDSEPPYISSSYIETRSCKETKEKYDVHVTVYYGDDSPIINAYVLAVENKYEPEYSSFIDCQSDVCAQLPGSGEEVILPPGAYFYFNIKYRLWVLLEDEKGNTTIERIDSINKSSCDDEEDSGGGGGSSSFPSECLTGDKQYSSDRGVYYCYGEIISWYEVGSSQSCPKNYYKSESFYCCPYGYAYNSSYYPDLPNYSAGCIEELDIPYCSSGSLSSDYSYCE